MVALAFGVMAIINKPLGLQECAKFPQMSGTTTFRTGFRGQNIPLNVKKKNDR
jgi:hypothetical protein